MSKILNGALGAITILTSSFMSYFLVVSISRILQYPSVVRNLILLSVFVLSSLEAKSGKLVKCSVLLIERMTDLNGSQQEHNAKVESASDWVRNRLRASSEQSVAPEDALLATLRSFRSEYEVKTDAFKHKFPLDEYDWDRHLLNLEILQEFFHDQVELIDIDHTRFRVAIKMMPGPLYPVFFENVARQIYENVNSHFEYSLKAFLLFKSESKLKRINYGTPIKPVATELARAYLETRNRLPQMGAMALQLFRTVKSEDAASVLPLDQVDPKAFDDFMLRDSSYRMLLHEFLKLRKTMKAFEEEPEIRREINHIQHEES